LAVLTNKIVGAVWEARRGLRPARIAAAVGHSPVAMDRRLWHAEQNRIIMGRNRAGFIDHAMPVARIDDEDERPIAILVNYACHPTIMAHRNSLITPDFPGPLRRTVEANVGGLCLFLQGATGDRQPRESFSSRRADYHRVGQRLGLAAAETALGLDTLPKVERLVEVMESGAELGLYADEPGTEPDGMLGVARRTIALPLTTLPALAEAEAAVERAAAALAEARARGDEAAIRAANYQSKRSAMYRGMARTHANATAATVELQAMRIGPLGLVAMPGEPFAEIGATVRQRSPFPVTMFSGYSNGTFAYIPMRSDHEEGGYGVWNSPLGPGAGEIVIEEAVALLGELRG
jgi:neutral ceramidase